MGPRAGRDGIRFPDRPARSQSLYRLSYPAHKLTQVLIVNYGIIIKSISTRMCTVWHVDKYKITF